MPIQIKNWDISITLDPLCTVHSQSIFDIYSKSITTLILVIFHPPLPIMEGNCC